MDDIKADLAEVKADVKAIATTLAANTESLIKHEARTTVAETRLTLLEKMHWWVIGLMGTVFVAMLVHLATH